MTGRAPFTDALFASEDLSWSPPKAFGGETQGAGGSPDRREQVLSCEGEDPSCSPLWRGETQGPVVRPTSGTRSSPPEGETERVLLGP